MTDRHHSADGKLERAKDKALGMHDDHPGVADHIGEAAGGITGVTAGAAAGSLAGPVGTVIGGIAGAMAGWWTGRAVAEAATSISEDDDRYYRRHFEASPNRPGDRRYQDMRPAYYLGHVASHNPEYRDRRFNEFEPELQRGWSSDPKHGSWDAARPYVLEGYVWGTSRLDDTDQSRGTADTARAAGDESRNRPA